MSNPSFTAPDYTTQAAATYKANIDAAIAANGNDYINLGFSYASGTGTFTVHDARGSALSSTNPAFVRFQDPDNPGYSKYISVEANQDFIDDAGSSEILNNLFGFTTSVAITDDVPFYLYAVSNDAMDTVQFMIGRVPHMVKSPVVAEIGAPDDAVADEQISLWSLDNIDETLYDENPCVCVGSFRMQMSASDDWTVQTLAVTDGIGQFQEGVEFTVPLGQFGADSGEYTIPNGGTSANFSGNTHTYYVYKSGRIETNYNITNDGGTDGSGAVTAYWTCPFRPASSDRGNCADVLINTTFELGMGVPDTTANRFLMVVQSLGNVIQWADFVNGNRHIKGGLDFMAKRD